MNKLELLGALLVKSLDYEAKDENPALAKVIDSADLDITDNLIEAQFKLWRSLGKPAFNIVYMRGPPKQDTESWTKES